MCANEDINLQAQRATKGDKRMFYGVVGDPGIVYRVLCIVVWYCVLGNSEYGLASRLYILGSVMMSGSCKPNLVSSSSASTLVVLTLL